MKSFQTSGANAYVIFVFPNNAAWLAFDAYLGSDPNIPKLFSTISHQEAHVFGAVSHKSRQVRYRTAVVALTPAAIVPT